jgi:hypothetical protein
MLASARAEEEDVHAVPLERWLSAGGVAWLACIARDRRRRSATARAERRRALTREAEIGLLRSIDRC